MYTTIFLDYSISQQIVHISAIYRNTGGLGSRSKRSNSGMGEPLIVAPIAVALDSVRVPTVSTREGGDTSPFLGVSNNSNSSSFRSDLSRSGEGGYIYLVEVQYHIKLHTGQVKLLYETMHMIIRYDIIK